MTLSKEKKQIISDNEHNIKVIAGPGAGKTKLIIKKVSELIKKDISPQKILIITYTNKAAEDLQKKIQIEFTKQKININKIQVSTIHRFCAQFIKENIDFFIEYKGYNVLDNLSQLLFIVKFNKSIRNEDTETIEPLKLKNYFGRIKDNYFFKDIKTIEHPIIESYISYCTKLKENKKMDYGDLINIVYNQINTNKELKYICENKYDYIFVDEYQDINKNQEKLIKQFIGKKTKILVVGDKNQSIYGFRGSDVTIFDNFESSFNNTKTYYLKKNYRSTKKIIELSNRFLDLSNIEKVVGNDDNTDGELTKDGYKITIKQYSTEEGEANDIINKIKQMKEDKLITDYSDIAILLRSVKGDSKRFTTRLAEENIKYDIIGEGGFFEIDYIKGILDCYKQLCDENNVLHLIENDFLIIKTEIDSRTIKKGGLAIYYKIIEKSSYLQNAIKEKNDSILDNLGKFSELIFKYSQIFTTHENYLDNFYKGISQIKSEFLTVEQPIVKANNSVKILTLHKAKGLEFPFVIIPGVNKNNYKIKEEDFITELFRDYNSSKDMERAFYVAITRAKQKLFISYYGNPSEYINKIKYNPDLINFNIENQSTLFEEKTKEHMLESNNPEEGALKLTYYKLIEYWKCPFAYKLRFNNNLAIPRTYPFTYGSILHKLLCNLNLKIKNKQSYDLDKLIIDNVPEYMNKFDFKKPLNKYLSDFKEEIKHIIAIEKPFEFLLGGAIITGRMDLMIANKSNQKIIVEFKSGKHTKHKEDETKKQINLYALSQNNRDLTEGLIYFFDGSTKIKFKLNKNQTELNIYDVITKIKSNKYEQNTANCECCVFYEYPICPFHKKFKILDVDSDDFDDNYSDSSNEI